MSLIQALAAEHEAFRRCLRRLGAACELPERQSRNAVRSLFDALLPALEAHSDLEELVFDAESDEPARRLVSAQHVELENLRQAVAAALESRPEAPAVRLRELTGLFIDRLESHFMAEEALLWPRLGPRASRTLERALEREARRRVRAVEAAVHWEKEGGALC